VLVDAPECFDVELKLHEPWMRLSGVNASVCPNRLPEPLDATKQGRKCHLVMRRPEQHFLNPFEAAYT